MKIDIPQIISALCRYFKIAIGEFDIVKDNLPSILENTVIKVEDMNFESTYLKEKFVTEYDIESPFLVLEFEKFIIYGSCISLIGLVLIFILSKILRKIKVFRRTLNQFFFNIPIRAFTEIYLEFAFMVCINAPSIGYQNISKYISSITALVVGGIVMIFPFWENNLMNKSYKILLEKKFLKRYGVMIEELHPKKV